MLESVLAAVREVAAAEIMPRHRQVVGQHKADGSLFTEADTAAQSALIDRLRRIDACPVLGEEMTTAQQQQLWADSHNDLWCIDPLDGTTNFVHGLPYFAVSVARIRNGRSVLGVVHNPATQETFWATRGGGAWFNGEPLPLRPPVGRLRDAVAGVDMKRLARPLARALAEQSPVCSQRNGGASALDWCYTAAGRYDLYLHGGQKLWDYAAGALILAEAGGRCATLDSDDFHATDPWQRSVIAASGAPLFDVWKDWIRARLPEDAFAMPREA